MKETHPVRKVFFLSGLEVIRDVLEEIKCMDENRGN